MRKQNPKSSRAKRPGAKPVMMTEANHLFASWKKLPQLVLAVSGGPDSVALMWLAARWRAKLASGPDLLAVTVDHGLRAGSGREARSVKKLASSLNIKHKTLRWQGEKPRTGLPSAARETRYRLLAQATRERNALHIVTAHTRDDQAETVMMRMARGSGLAGLAAMTNETRREDGVIILRPFLDIPKERLIATLDRAGIGYADDPTNRDPRFTRPRWRALMPALSQEGLDAHNLARLATRLGRANAALESITDITERSIAVIDRAAGTTEIAVGVYLTLPEEVRLRLLARAVGRIAYEGEAGLGQIEALLAKVQAIALSPVKGPRRRAVKLKQTLSGALVELSDDLLSVSAAPRRRTGAGQL